jgi:hypothetical protein
VSRKKQSGNLPCENLIKFDYHKPNMKIKTFSTSFLKKIGYLLESNVKSW